MVASYEKHMLQDAAAALRANQLVIREGFALELTRAISLDTKVGLPHTGDSASRSFLSLRFDQLELMGDAQVQEALDAARLQQFLLLVSDTSLAEFSARLSTAQGFKTVQADKNPLRPEVFSQALLKLLRRLPVDNDVRSRWLTYGAQLLGNELQTLYVMLDELLEKQGVVVAPYGVVGAPGDKNRKRATAYAEDPQGGNAGQDLYPASADDAPPQDYFGQSTYLADDVSAQGRYLAQTGHAGRAVYPVQGQTVATAYSRQYGYQALGGGSVQVSREQLLTLDHLHRLMVGDYDESFQSLPAAAVPHGIVAGQQDFSHTVPAAMDALAELETHGLASMAGHQARVMPPLPVALLREQLKAEARNLGQALGIEVVGLMIEKLANDERLLPPVRQLIANAEPAFLRLGMTDPRFFSDKKHSARLLLEAITANSLAYPSEDAPGFAGFMRDVQEVTAVLTEGYLSDAHDFAALLADFEEKQTHHTADVSDAQNVAVQALLRAEQRNLLAEKIGIEIRSRSDFISGNRVIASFLTGPWAQVMANERLLGEHGGIGSAKAVYSLTLGDLLWSLNILQASRHRKRLVKIIPGMLNSVREGLLSIDYPLDQSKAFYDALMESHEAAMKPLNDPPEAGFNSYNALEKAVDKESQDSDGASEPWLAPNEAQQSGFIEDWTADNPGFKATEPRRQNQLPGDPAALQGRTGDGPPDAPSGQAAELRLGAWVELLSENTWLRAQLTWISPHNTLFMFTSDGGRSHSMTSRMLQQLLSARRLKVISGHGLLEGALDSVARAAMRNSVDIGTDM